MDNSTNNYYNNNAQEFINKTFSADVGDIIIEFINKIPPNGKILDVGCGSGRDSLFFIKNGFEVVAFDASSELAKLASEKIGQAVICEDLLKMKWENEFDGVWAMASLLHLRRDEMPVAIQNCFNALKENGELFISLKVGKGESYDENGRFFTYYDSKEIINIFNNLGFKSFSIDSNEDTLGRSVQWINIHAVKSPQLIASSTFKKNNKY